MPITGSQTALMYALSGVARAGATRSAYHSAYCYLSIGGTHVAHAPALASYAVDRHSLRIEDLLDEIPNTCTFEVTGFTPTKGQEVIITLGSKNNSERLFAGHILRVQQRQETAAALVHYVVNAIDYTWLVAEKLVTAVYTNTDGATILRALFAAYAPGFTTTAIAASLGTLDEITFTNEPLPTCVTRVMQRLGGYWYADYLKDVHAWVGTETGVQHPVSLTTAHVSLEDFFYDSDNSQLINRVYVEGRGTKIVGRVAAADTIIPIESSDMFSADADVFAKVSFQGSTGGAVHLTFTGVVDGGGGSLVGPGFTPSSGPSVALTAGSGVTAGSHSWAVTFVTASGETIPSPTVSSSTGVVTPPSLLDISSRTNGSLDTYSAYNFAVTFVNAAGETTPSTRNGYWTLGSSEDGFNYVVPLGPTGTTARKIYRTEGQTDMLLAAAATLKLVDTIADNVTTGYADTIADASLGAAAPSSNTATAAGFALSGIAIGPTGTTSRKVYRTAAGGSVYKLLSTIGDNTTTTLSDTTADGSLGAVAPTADTSALRAEVVSGSGFYTTVSGFATNGAATSATSSAPVFTSATYNFVAGDVGAYLYIKSGVNWTVGRYRIVSVAANAATLDAACASVASPTNATWGVDYSVLASPRISFTDLVIGATNTQFTSAGNPVGPNFVGNVLAIRDGLSFIVQRIIITGTTGGTIGVADKIIGVAAATGGIGTLGGAASAGLVEAGATSVLLASAGAAESGGGWAIIGNGDQVIRYTGTSGNSLTGVPASGVGSIGAAIGYGSTVTFPPMLTGIPASGTGSIPARYYYPFAEASPVAADAALTPGDELYLVVQRDDVPAQVALAALIGGSDDGVREEWAQDRRLSVTEARARGDARLSQIAAALDSITYTSRDKNTRAGRTATVSLGSPTSVSADFKIQHVTISGFGANAALFPTYAVEASSTRFSFDDLLRLARKA